MYSLHRSVIVFWALLCFLAGLAQLWGVLVAVCLYGVWRYGFVAATGVLVFCSISFIGGNWRIANSQPSLTAIPFEQTVTFTATVIKPVQIKGDQQKVTVSNEAWPGYVLLLGPLYPQYLYGDIVNVQCQLQQPPANPEFDYAKYLARYQVYALCYRPQIELVGHTRHWLFSPLYQLRNTVQQQVRLLWPEPISSLIQGVLLGLQDDIPTDINDLFRRTGTVHILVVSGMHVMLLAQLIERCTKRWLTIGQRFILLIVVLGAFCIVTGLAASVIRASLMGLIIPVAALSGRPRRAHITLTVVAAVMAAYNPYILLNDLGFQLSFLATIGLIYFQPLVARFTQWLPEWFSLRETISTSLAAAIPTAPLIAWQFGTFSPISFFANIIVLPVSNLLLFAGAGITGLAIFFPSMAQLLAYLLWRLTWLMLHIQTWLSSLPQAYLENIVFSDQALLIAYGIISLYIVWRIERPLYVAS